MNENFGLLDSAVQGTEIYLMSADEFANWLSKASNVQQAWVTAQGFTAKPGKAITFATVDGQIDFAIGVYGDHAIWDGASIAANLPIGQWQFVVNNNDLSNQSLESLALGWGPWAIPLSPLSGNTSSPYKLSDNSNRRSHTSPTWPVTRYLLVP